MAGKPLRDMPVFFDTKQSLQFRNCTVRSCASLAAQRIAIAKAAKNAIAASARACKTTSVTADQNGAQQPTKWRQFMLQPFDAAWFLPFVCVGCHASNAGAPVADAAATTVVADAAVAVVAVVAGISASALRGAAVLQGVLRCPAKAAAHRSANNLQRRRRCSAAARAQTLAAD